MLFPEDQSAIVRTQRLTVADAVLIKKPQGRYKLTSPGDQTALCTPVVTKVALDVYLQGMRYTKVNNASSEFSMSSRAVWRDLASQNLYQVLVDIGALNQGVTAPTQRLLACKTLER